MYPSICKISWAAKAAASAARCFARKRPPRGRRDVCRGEPVLTEKLVLCARFSEGILRADDLHRRGQVAREHLCHRAAKAAVNGVIFHRYDRAGLSRLRKKRFFVQRLNAVEVEHRGVDSVRLKQLRRAKRLPASVANEPLL